mmetsp:Transcript_25809/g.63501  ORF Transcript_25809/g.63501 Transcript_25809/m.63501 type:complete len:210 (+) Transcript_25809:51-680(+)
MMMRDTRTTTRNVHTFSHAYIALRILRDAMVAWSMDSCISASFSPLAPGSYLMKLLLFTLSTFLRGSTISRRCRLFSRSRNSVWHPGSLRMVPDSSSVSSTCACSPSYRCLPRRLGASSLRSSRATLRRATLSAASTSAALSCALSALRLDRSRRCRLATRLASSSFSCSRRRPCLLRCALVILPSRVTAAFLLISPPSSAPSYMVSWA